MLLNRLKALIKQFPFIYPLRFISSCKDWIIHENLQSGSYNGLRRHTFQLIEPEENQMHALPDLSEAEDQLKFSANIFYQTVPAYLFYLKDVYLYRQSGLVLSRRNYLFKEFTHRFNIEPITKFILKHPFYTFSTQIQSVKGIGAVLISPESHNYYHWLFDVLPRIKLYETILTHIDYFCISAAVPKKITDILPLFGIPTDKVLYVNDTQKFHFNNLYVASLPGSEGRSPRWAVNYLRQKLIKAPQPALIKKVYFARGSKSRRKILNEEQLISHLEKQEFEIVIPDEFTINQQIALMQQAAIVISAHGAALSNLLFAQKGITVIEIFSPDYFRTDCYFTLSRILNLNYKYLQGTKPANAHWGDIIVDIKSLIEIIPAHFTTK